MRKHKVALSLVLAVAITSATFGLTSNSATAITNASSAKCGASRLSLVKQFSKTVSIMCDTKWMYVSSLEVPNDEMMVGITGWNQQVPLPFIMSEVLTTIWKIPLKGTWSKSTTQTTGVSATALMINGVPLFNPTKPSQGGNQTIYSPKSDPKLIGELDNCDGHSGRGDDYHYHAYPGCMVKTLKSKNSLLGWVLDGYPIYGLTETNGSIVRNLDSCSGHDIKNGIGYHYHFTTKAPYSPMCFHGVLPTENLPEHQPTAANARPPGGPAKVLITKMEFNLTGTSTLTYTYNGVVGSVSYTPTESTDSNKECWNFSYINPPPGSPGTGNQLVCRGKYGKTS